MHQPKALWGLSAELAQRNRARAGNRTL